jgi:hypothetical protein
VGPLVIVMHQESIQVSLQGAKLPVNLFPEGDLIKLVAAGLMKAFANAVGLWMLDLGPGVFNFVET